MILLTAALLAPIFSPTPPQATVRGTVWTDLDGDGQRDPSEHGRADVEVVLLDAHGTPVAGVAPVTTDAGGAYAFAGVPAGEFRVAFTRPVGTRFTASDVGPPELGATAISADDSSLDSDVGTDVGAYAPERPGPWPTGMRYFEWTRVETEGPWPLNAWVVYPAAAGTVGARTTVREVYVGDPVDAANALATVKHVLPSQGISPDIAIQTDLDEPMLDVRAVLDAPVASGESFPVVLLLSGLESGVADVVEIADRLASHGYVAVCFETPAFHTSIALGSRLTANGGAYVQSDFDHIPQLGGSALATFLSHGYTIDGYLLGNFQQSLTARQDIVEAYGGHLLDELEALNAQAGGAFEGVLDFERVGYMGFSMGSSTATPLLTNDARIDVAVNLDSGTNLFIPKPMMWVGNSQPSFSGAPTLHANFPSDFHGHYFFIPAIRFDPPIAPTQFHRENHHHVRDTLLVAWMGLWLKGRNDYRETLGLEGLRNRFDDFVRPTRSDAIPGWSTMPFEFDAVRDVTRDAGLVPVRMWLLDGGRVLDVQTDFAEPGVSIAASDVTDHGAVQVDDGSGSHVAPTAPLRGAAVDVGAMLWFLHGDELHSLDRGALVAGSRAASTLVGSLPAGLPDVHALTFDASSGRLFGLAGDDRRAIVAIDSAQPASARVIGRVGPRVGEPLGLALDARGSLWISDAANAAIARVEPATGRVLQILPTAAGHVGNIAYHPADKTILGLGLAGADVSRIRMHNGLLEAAGDLSPHAVSASASIALEPVVPTNAMPWIDSVARGGNDVDPIAVGGGAPLVRAARIGGAPADWDGWALRARFVDDTGAPHVDSLSVAARPSMSVGGLTTIDDVELLILDGYELLRHGVVVGHLEDDLGMASGGERLLPLTIRLAGAATTEDVEALIEAIVHEGGAGRRIGLELVSPEGTRGRTLVVAR